MINIEMIINIDSILLRLLAGIKLGFNDEVTATSFRSKIIQVPRIHSFAKMKSSSRTLRLTVRRSLISLLPQVYALSQVV